MFTKKNDPVVDSVKSVMRANEIRRQVEDALNEQFGVSSRKAIPHEHRREYDNLLEEAYKCAMKEDKDHSKDYHVVSPEGYTVLVTNIEKGERGAEGSAQRYGEGYKVYRGDQLPKNWKGSGTGSSMFAGKKKMDESKEGSTPKTEREADLAAAKPPRSEEHTSELQSH